MTSRPGAAGPVGASVLLAVALVALAVYANSLGNGFAYDDRGVVVENPVITEGGARAALTAPWWTAEAGGGRLYRPTTQAALALQWGWFGGSPLGFHAVNVALHVAVSLLVALSCGLLLGGGAPGSTNGRLAALAGGLVFAVHPVHVEAVANVVGQAELWAALGVVGAVCLHLRTRDASGRPRLLGTLGIGALYALAFGAKESAVVLPALVVLLEAFRASGPRAFGGRVVEQTPRLLLMAGVGLFLLAIRFEVLGALAGEDVTAVLAGLDPADRFVRVLPLWAEYLRLMVWPVDLAADYEPGVLFPAAGPSLLQVIGGGAALAAGVVGVVVGWRRRSGPARGAALGAAWFAVAVLPVSNLLIPTGSLLAERTLYLPSVGLALVAGAIAVAARERLESSAVSIRRAFAVGAGAVVLALAARTLARNPVWFSSFSVMESLVRDHPESWRAHLARADGLARAGQDEAAAEAYRAGLAALPGRYALVTAAGVFFKDRGAYAEARPLLERAVALQPERPSTWVLLAELDLLEGRFQEAHRTAARGIAAADPSAGLWSVLSEAYIGGGMLEAAVRARSAALALDPGSTRDWERLVELLEATGADSLRIEEARRRAGELRRREAAAEEPS